MSAEEIALRVRKAQGELQAVGIRIEMLSCQIRTAMEIENTMPAVAIAHPGERNLATASGRTVCGIPLLVTP